MTAIFFSVLLVIGIILMTRRLVVVVVQSRRYDRELVVAERAARQVAVLEADLFRNPREWVAEAERAVETELRPRDEVTPHESLSDREMVGTLTSQTIATRKATHGDGDTIEG